MQHVDYNDSFHSLFAAVSISFTVQILLGTGTCNGDRTRS